jgi:molybdate transport system substrate-binding protein
MANRLFVPARGRSTADAQGSVLFGSMEGRLWRAVAVAIAVAVLLAGCGAPAESSTVITVYATSAMIHSLTEIGKKFQHDNPGVSVEYIFAPTSDLAAELSAGATADVFVAGEPEQMDRLLAAGLVQGLPVAFATNRLVMVTKPGNPAHIAEFADLARPGTRAAECAAQMTCASSVRQIEHHTGVTLSPVAKEVSPADVIRDVVSGRADAGLVFFSDALMADSQISWVDFPDAARAEAVCSIAVMKGSDQAALSSKFISEVTNVVNRPVFGEAGFGVPPAKSVR